MIIPRTSTETIIGALRVLSRDIVTDDGVANACLREAADRMEEMQRQLEQILKREVDIDVLISGDADQSL